MNKLWKLRNNVIGRTRDKSSAIEYITISNINIYSTAEISNQFGKFYLELGVSLAKSIKLKENKINDYLAKITRSKHSLYLYPILNTEIIHHIDRLPPKNSSG